MELTIAERWALVANTLQQILSTKTVAETVDIMRGAARSVAQADGITIVKRICMETDYLAEDTIEPLWAGLQFPIDKCLAGRAMTQQRTILVPDITQVEDIPLNVYLATFIRSLVAVPIGDGQPTHAICAYWRDMRTIDDETVALMEALARGMGASIAMIEILGLVDAANRRAAVG